MNNNTITSASALPLKTAKVRPHAYGSVKTKNGRKAAKYSNVLDAAFQSDGFTTRVTSDSYMHVELPDGIKPSEVRISIRAPESAAFAEWLKANTPSIEDIEHAIDWENHGHLVSVKDQSGEVTVWFQATKDANAHTPRGVRLLCAVVDGITLYWSGEQFEGKGIDFDGAVQ